jgi:hypothetical protein
LSEHDVQAENSEGPDWLAVAHDLEGQVVYVLRRCLAAEGSDGDPPAMKALIAGMEDTSRLKSRAGGLCITVQAARPHQFDARQPWQ